MAKRITFDSEIIETLYTSLRQFTNDHLTEFEERHIRARMNDVGYLVEDNTMDDFCLSSETDVTHGKSTFEDDPEQQLLRCKLGTKCKCWE